MKMRIIYFILLVAIVSCVRKSEQQQHANHDTTKQMQQSFDTTINVEVNVFKNDSTRSGFGYDILMNGNTYVHQPNIPAVAGNSGFRSEESARKTGEFVAWKIKHNIMPPSVDVKELDSIGVLK